MKLFFGHKMKKNPFVGHIPYKEINAADFLGRTKDVQSLLEIIQKNKLTAIIGAKGSGKSSLINAGLIPRLKEGFLGQGGDQWAICKFRPGISPIENLVYALVSNGVLTDDGKANTSDFKSYLQTIRDFKQLGIIEIFKNSEILNRKNLLIVVDQMDDLFRFKRYFDADTEDDDNLLLDIIARTVQVKDVPVYFLLALRSNYTDKLSDYVRLQEIISRSIYSIKNIGREGIQEIIEKHFQLNNMNFDPKVREQIENVVLADTTKLQNLQYLMFKLYEKGQAKADGSTPIKINQNWVDELGGIKNNIRKGLQSFYDDLTTSEKALFEKLHRALMHFQDNNGSKLYATFNAITKFTNSTSTQINQLLQKINLSLHGFYELIPPLITNIEVNENKIPDKKSVFAPNFSSNFEWKLIKDWENDEQKNFQDFVDFENNYKKFKLSQGSYLVPPALDLARNWQEKKEVNAAWARKYNLDFKGTNQYIDNSYKIYWDDVNADRIRQKNEKRNRNWIVVGFALAALVLLVLLIFSISVRSEMKINNDKLKSEKAINMGLIDSLKGKQNENQNLIEDLRKQQDKLEESNNELTNSEKKLNNANKNLYQNITALNKAADANRKKSDSIRDLADVNEQQKKQEILNKQYALKITKFSQLKRNLLYEIQSMDFLNEKQKIIDTIEAGLIEYNEFNSLSEELGKTEEPFEIYDWLKTALMILDGKKDFVETSINQYSKENKSSIRSVALDAQNNIYYGGDNGILLKYDTTEKTTQKILELEKNDRIRSVFISDGVYVGTFNGDVYKLNLNQAYIEVPDKIKFKNTKIGAIKNLFKSPNNGNLFIVGTKGIIEKSTYGERFLNTPIDISFFDNEQLYFSFNGRIFLYEKGEKTEFTLQNRENELKNISALAVGNGKMYLGTESGLIYIYQKPESGATRKSLKFIDKIIIHKSKITRLLYAKNEALLFSASLDNQIFKHSLTNKINKPLQLVGHDQWVWDLDLFNTYDKSGKMNTKLVSADENGNLITWYIDQNALANKVKEKVNTSK